MIVPRLALLLVISATPVVAQDASSSSSAPSAGPSADASSSVPAPPASLGDSELEMAVRAAYGAAASFAAAHGNYFARDGVLPPLHDAVAAAVSAAYPSVALAPDTFADLDAARVCRAAPGTELRISTNLYGDGITLVAVTEARLFAYDYDPHNATDIKVIAATGCIKAR